MFPPLITRPDGSLIRIGQESLSLCCLAKNPVCLFCIQLGPFIFVRINKNIGLTGDAKKVFLCVQRKLSACKKLGAIH